MVKIFQKEILKLNFENFIVFESEIELRKKLQYFDFLIKKKNIDLEENKLILDINYLENLNSN